MELEELSFAHAESHLIAEQTIIGILLRKPDLYHQMKVRTIDFSDERLRTIFEAITELTYEGIKPELIDVATYLVNKERLEKAGGPGFIAGLEDNIGTTINWEYHQEIVVKHSTYKELIKLHKKMGSDLNLKWNNINIKDYLQNTVEKLNVLYQFIGGGNGSNLAKEVKDWCLGSDGIFNVTDLYRDLGVSKQKGQEEEYRRTTKNITIILHRLVKQNLIEKVGAKRGQFRLLDQELSEIDYRDENEDRPINLLLPMDLHELIYTYPKNIIIVAGESNAGKTAFLLETIFLNDQHLDIEYFCCEGGKQELRKRLKAFDRPIDDWRFKSWERFEDFADVIRPNKVNMIDYLDIGSEFYMVGEKIKNIRQRLENGIAIIALQKDEKKKLAIGGQFTKHAARTYISIAKEFITMEKAKNTINPLWKLDGKKIRFRLEGPHFINLNPRRLV